MFTVEISHLTAKRNASDRWARPCMFCESLLAVPLIVDGYLPAEEVRVWWQDLYVNVPSRAYVPELN